MSRRPGRPIELDLDPDAPICPSRKRPFRTAADAREALDRVRGRRFEERTGKTERRYYQCPGCHWWHLTHLRKR